MRRFIFFDLDGTLADTDRDIRGAWKAALADLGLDCPDFDAKFVAGPPLDEMARILFPDRFTPTLAEAIRVGFARHYDYDGFPETREYPGVLDDVRRLKGEGRTVAIVTNKRYEGARRMAAHFGWDRVFDGVFAGDMYRDGSIGKLRKGALLAHVMRLYGAAQGDCALIGDTRGDIEAAAENGILSVAVTWGYGKTDEIKNADIVCGALPFPV